MRKLFYAVSICFLLSVDAFAQSIGPLPYLSFADSPFISLYSNRQYVEDFEDGLLNTPFVTQSGGQSVNAAGGTFTDSVDYDDGAIDGSGTLGRSLYTADGATGITFTFSPLMTDRLPNAAGIVWTDLSGTADVFLEAFDKNNVSLGVISAGPLNDGVSTGETAEDRFLGWYDLEGISRIRIYQSGSDMEVDHLQYGLQVPEPSTFGLALAAMILCYRCRT